MGQLVENIGEQKLQYLLTSWVIAKKIGNKEARLVGYDNALGKR